MRRALFLYNPVSGLRRDARLAHVEAAAGVFRSAGVECVVEPTRGPNTAAAQTSDAIARGCDAILVCGGDGTVNEALHGMIGSQAALGVIPLGTGNGLANDLKLPRDPAAAARLLVCGAIRPILLPRIDYIDRAGQPGWRYFLIGAGIGADAEMVYRLAMESKQRWGMAAYYAESTRQWLTHDFPLFTAEFCDGGVQRRESVSQVLAIRISWFGGLLKNLAPGADLYQPHLQFVFFKTQRRLSYLRYMLGVWFERGWRCPDVEVLSAIECRCVPLPAVPPPDKTPRRIRIYIEADGELLGTLPASVSMTDTSLNLLVPNDSTVRISTKS
jgi:diacylglycerol kinase family enzyme